MYVCACVYIWQCPLELVLWFTHKASILHGGAKNWACLGALASEGQVSQDFFTDLSCLVRAGSGWVEMVHRIGPQTLFWGGVTFPFNFPSQMAHLGQISSIWQKKVISQLFSLNYVRSKFNTSKIRANISRFCRSRSGGFSTRPHFENFGGYTVKSSSTGHSHIFIYISLYIYDIW